MKQLNLKKLQNRLRDKFLKSGVKMVGPETIYFSKDTLRKCLPHKKMVPASLIF